MSEPTGEHAIQIILHNGWIEWDLICPHDDGREGDTPPCRLIHDEDGELTGGGVEGMRLSRLV